MIGLIALGLVVAAVCIEIQQSTCTSCRGSVYCQTDSVKVGNSIGLHFSISIMIFMFALTHYFIYCGDIKEALRVVIK